MAEAPRQKRAGTASRRTRAYGEERRARRARGARIERFQRIEELFHRAADLDPGQRAELYRDECADDPEIGRRVEALLAAGGDAEEEIGGAVRSAMGALDGTLAAGVPERIGPWRVIREIGRGGFSTVYLAERDDDQFRMKAAIKLVRHAGADDVTRRLRRERQILANLDHPNIARILDGGSFVPSTSVQGSGVPYVVMEYIEGQPIDAFCQRLELSERLELFRRVCDAVQYAHGNLVLHRDIKPSNILVTEGGVPKLLDFGIAKVLTPDPATAEAETVDLADPDLASTLTRPGVRVLTPEYASPEQVEGRPLTTATDVYSLGVLLYLLVTGERPYRFDQPSPGRGAHGVTWGEIERVVREVEPEPPSAHRGTERGGWRRAQDDLDTVVLQALRKQPDRRYASVEQFSDDVRCYLAGHPVSARKDTVGYRMKRFVARHRTPVAATVLIFLTLVAAVILTAWQARVARDQRALAERQKTRAERVAGFLENLFEDASPYRSLESNLTARQILERGARRLQAEMAADPELQSTLAATLGRVHREMNLYQDAEDLLKMALDLRRGLDPGSAAEAEILRDLGILFLNKKDCSSSLAMLDQALEIEGRSHDADSSTQARTLYAVGAAKLLCDPPAAAEPLQQALAMHRRQLGDESEEVADTESLLAELWFKQGDYNQVEGLLQQVLAKRRRIHGPDHPKVARSLNDLAAVAHANGDYQDAVTRFQQVLAMQRKSFGERHGVVAHALKNLAISTVLLDRTTPAGVGGQEAEDLLNEAISISRQVYGEGAPLEADCLHQLGSLRRRAGDDKQAEELFTTALEAIRRAFGPDHPKLMPTHLALAKTIARRDPARAEAVLRENVALRQRLLPADDYRQSFPLVSLGRLLLDRGDAAAAEPLLRRAVENRHQGLPPGHWQTGAALTYLGRSLADQGKLEEAERIFRASYDNFLANFGAQDSRTLKARDRLAELREPH